MRNILPYAVRRRTGARRCKILMNHYRSLSISWQNLNENVHGTQAKNGHPPSRNKTLVCFVTEKTTNVLLFGSWKIAFFLQTKIVFCIGKFLLGEENFILAEENYLLQTKIFFWRIKFSFTKENFCCRIKFSFAEENCLLQKKQNIILNL